MKTDARGGLRANSAEIVYSPPSPISGHGMNGMNGMSGINKMNGMNAVSPRIGQNSMNGYSPHSDENVNTNPNQNGPYPLSLSPQMNNQHQSRFTFNESQFQHIMQKTSNDNSIGQHSGGYSSQHSPRLGYEISEMGSLS